MVRYDRYHKNFFMGGETRELRNHRLTTSEMKQQIHTTMQGKAEKLLQKPDLMASFDIENLSQFTKTHSGREYKKGGYRKWNNELLEGVLGLKKLNASDKRMRIMALQIFISKNVDGVGLEADGKLGPKTLRAMTQFIREKTVTHNNKEAIAENYEAVVTQPKRKPRVRAKSRNKRSPELQKKYDALAYPDGFYCNDALPSNRNNIQLPKSLKKKDILAKPRIAVGNKKSIKTAVPPAVYRRIKNNPLLQKHLGTQAGIAVAAVLCRNEHITAAYCGEFGRICQDFAEINRRKRRKNFDSMPDYTEWNYKEVPQGKGKYIKTVDNKYVRSKGGNYNRAGLKKVWHSKEHHLIPKLTKKYIKKGLSPAAAKKKAIAFISKKVYIGTSVVVNNQSHDNWGSHYEIPIKYLGNNKYTVISYPGGGRPANVYYKYYGPNKKSRKYGRIVRLYNQRGSRRGSNVA